jgi:organic radical activating enzyme
MHKAKVADIFFSIQGEGIYAAKEQLFIRFYDCTYNCRFCDTRLTSYDKYTPLELYNLIKRVAPLFQQSYHSLCLTGGEPLLEKDFLKKFLKLIKYDGITTYLETNGILADALNELIDEIDIIAMDFKLPSSTAMKPFWLEHSRFLKIALRKKVFIKIVICAATKKEDLTAAIDLILNLRAEKTPLVLQPNFFELSKELLANIRLLKRYCSQYLDCVQVIPQLHKFTGVK